MSTSLRAAENGGLCPQGREKHELMVCVVLQGSGC
jgi:hypothetical protein